MILVDSTIWIEFLKFNPIYQNDMETLLENMKVYALEPVFAELLYGVRNEKERFRILSYWKVLPRIPLREDYLIDAADFANKNNFHNLGIGIIDSILISTTLKHNCFIWTLDKKILNNIESHFIYRP